MRSLSTALDPLLSSLVPNRLSLLYIGVRHRSAKAALALAALLKPAHVLGAECCRLLLLWGRGKKRARETHSACAQEREEGVEERGKEGWVVGWVGEKGGFSFAVYSLERV